MRGMRLRQAQDDYQIDDETLGGQQANSLLELIKSCALKRKAPAENKKAKSAADKAAAEAAKAREQQVCSMLRYLTGSRGLLAPPGAVMAAAGIHGISDSEKADSCARHPATEQLARGCSSVQTGPSVCLLQATATALAVDERFIAVLVHSGPAEQCCRWQPCPRS